MYYREIIEVNFGTWSSLSTNSGYNLADAPEYAYYVSKEKRP